MQATTSYTSGDVPFYDLALLGGEDRMRGYYKGALRDKVLFDTQVEYRMPVWNIFGITTWIAYWPGRQTVTKIWDSMVFGFPMAVVSG